VSLLEAGESFAVTAEAAGWAWVRVPWDPYWHSHDDTPVLKGGSGHIVAWVDEGQNNFGWRVPRQVDIAAIATTAAAAPLALVLLIAGPRRPIRRQRRTARVRTPRGQPRSARGAAADHRRHDRSADLRGQLSSTRAAAGLR